MESSEPREPSYYEVALTNRQVLVAFVVLLTCVLAAFLSGVWVGRGAAHERAARVAPAVAVAPAAAPIEQLTFFADKAPGRNGGAKPAAAPATRPGAAPETDSAAEAMRRTLEAEMAAHREGGSAAPAAGAATPAAPATAAVPLTPGARAAQKPGPAAPAPAGAAAVPAKPAVSPAPEAVPAAAPAPAAVAPAAGSIWIQVYSSGNAERARQIAAGLRKARYAVIVAEIPKNGQTTWRVRVGPYGTRAKAEAAATRLRREQKLDTWLTDTP